MDRTTMEQQNDDSFLLTQYRQLDKRNRENVALANLGIRTSEDIFRDLQRGYEEARQPTQPTQARQSMQSTQAVPARSADQTSQMSQVEEEQSLTPRLPEPPTFLFSRYNELSATE